MPKASDDGCSDHSSTAMPKPLQQHLCQSSYMWSCITQGEAAGLAGICLVQKGCAWINWFVQGMFQRTLFLPALFLSRLGILGRTQSLSVSEFNSFNGDSQMWVTNFPFSYLNGQYYGIFKKKMEKGGPSSHGAISPVLHLRHSCCMPWECSAPSALRISGIWSPHGSGRSHRVYFCRRS